MEKEENVEKIDDLFFVNEVSIDNSDVLLLLVCCSFF
jgi:hypothetical protein